MIRRSIYRVATFAVCSQLPGSAGAQPIRSIVEMIDLKCYRIEGDVASLDLPLVLDHLNPVLRDLGAVIVREPAAGRACREKRFVLAFALVRAHVGRGDGLPAARGRKPVLPAASFSAIDTQTSGLR